MQSDAPSFLNRDDPEVDYLQILLPPLSLLFSKSFLCGVGNEMKRSNLKTAAADSNMIARWEERVGADTATKPGNYEAGITMQGINEH